MPTNYGALVYGPIFRTQAVTAHLVPREGVAVDILTLDDTEGAEVEGAETLLPVVRVKYADLAAAAIGAEDLDEGTITMPDMRTWRIENAREEPTPSGRMQGMVMMVLSANG